MSFLRNELALDRQNPFFGFSEGDHIEYDEPEGKRVGPATPITKEKKGTRSLRGRRHDRGGSPFQGRQVGPRNLLFRTFCGKCSRVGISQGQE